MADSNSNDDHNTNSSGPDLGEVFGQALQSHMESMLDDYVTHRQLHAALPSDEELECHCPNQDFHFNPGSYLTVDEAPELIKSVIEETGGHATTTDIINALSRGNPEIGAYLFPARKIGPSAPAGEYHDKSRWGIHFETKTGFHIRRATIDAKEASTFTAVLGTYDGDDRFYPVDETEIIAEEGEQRINLDLHAPEAGEYLLTRPETVPLRRADYEDINQTEFSDGLRIMGGSKPGDYRKPSPFWYYFFDLEIAAHDGAHVDK